MGNPHTSGSDQPPGSPREDQRLAALRGLQVLDTPREAAFDDLTALVADICQTPIALISLIDESRQWFKSAVGLKEEQTPRKVAFCAHALDNPDLLLVPDATQDPRFAANPLVTGEPGIRFYAGAPLVTPEGHTLGTLCVIDRVPRQLNERQLTALRVLGRQVMTELQLRHRLREHAKAEEALRQSEAGQRQLVRSLENQRARLVEAQAVAKVGSWETDLVTMAVGWSGETHRIFGTNPETFAPTHAGFLELVHPDDRAAVDRAFQQSLGAREVQSIEHRVLLPDGSLKFIMERWQVYYDAHARPLRATGTCRDITERKIAEEELRYQAALLDKAQDAIIVRDLAHRITYWNKSAERLYGWTAAEAAGRSVRELLYFDPGIFDDTMTRLLAQGEWTGELVQRRKGGGPLTIEGRWTLVRDEAGRPRAVLAINTDITERKKLEQQFLRAQRLESIGTLAGGIAHDLNNLLAPITMGVDLLKLFDPPPRSLPVIENIERSARRGTELVKQVLSFARGVEGARVALQVRHILNEVESIAVNTFPKNITVETRLPRDLWPVLADPTQLNQVVMNLCVNARDAMPDGGRLELVAGNTELDAQYAAMNRGMVPGRYVLIQVTDTGTGMPREIIDRIFEPFFTTKELGKGTGLGLSTVLGIVRSHGGFVNVYSEVGRGSTFKVYLPAQAADAGTAADGHVGEALPRGNGELILVVDDETSILDITKQTLLAFGYRVLTAGDGAQAISLYALQRDEVALVLTDMMMPVMDGTALIRALQRINPKVRVIAASGLRGNQDVAHATSAGVKHFLPKPYSADMLLQLINQVLHDGGSRPPL